MRVLFWSPVFWPKIGGVEVHAANLLPALKARGYEYLVLTIKNHSDQPGVDEYEGLPIHRLSFWQRDNYTQIDALIEIRQKVAALQRAFAPDLIHINDVNIGDFFHLITANVAPAPVLVTLHGEWLPRQNGVVKRMLSAADWVAGCSQAILDKGRGLAPDIISRSSVIHNGVKAPALLPEPLPFAPPRLLCLGRLSPEKGFDLALHALSVVMQEFPEIRLVIAGDGPARLELEQQAAMLGIRHHVDFLGWVGPGDVPALINSASMVLMPSRQESLPLVALEAALMARPVVATRIGGLPEVVAHEQTGLLVDAEEAQALADAVSYLLRRPELAADMGRTARLHALALFSWQSHVDGYDALYRKLTSRTPIMDAAAHPNLR